jgi:hypothetical protein
MQARIKAIIIVLGTVGLCRAAYFHFEIERHRPPQPAIDARYQGARAFLPSAGEIGYISDARVARLPGEYETSPGTRLYVEAQYSLAPLVLRVNDEQASIVLVNVNDPAALPRLIETHRLHMLARVNAAVAVASRALP